MMWSIFSCTCWPSVSILWEAVSLDLLSFFNWVACFFMLSYCWVVVWVVYVLGILTPYRSYHLQVFSPYQWVILAFFFFNVFTRFEFGMKWQTKLKTIFFWGRRIYHWSFFIRIIGNTDKISSTGEIPFLCFPSNRVTFLL